jgi:hypothetical protein
MNGCEDYLKTEDSWVHLRLCRQRGRIGCCDSSKNRHATKNYHVTGYPIREPYDPPDPWSWCYLDEEMLGFTGNQTVPLHTSSIAFEDLKLR